jgi:hypothetical protein
MPFPGEIRGRGGAEHWHPRDGPLIDVLDSPPVTPVTPVQGCLWIIKDLRAITPLVFVVWSAVVLIWYFAYGIKHSHLGRHEHVALSRRPISTTSLTA